MTGWVFDADLMHWELLVEGRFLCGFSYDDRFGYYSRCYCAGADNPEQTLHFALSDPADAAKQAIKLLSPEDILALVHLNLKPPTRLHGWYEGQQQHLLFFDGKLRAGCTAHRTEHGKYWVRWVNKWNKYEDCYRREGDGKNSRVKRTRMRTIVENLYLTPEERLTILVAPT